MTCHEFYTCHLYNTTRKIPCPGDTWRLDLISQERGLCRRFTQEKIGGCLCLKGSDVWGGVFCHTGVLSYPLVPTFPLRTIVPRPGGRGSVHKRWSTVCRAPDVASGQRLAWTQAMHRRPPAHTTVPGRRLPEAPTTPTATCLTPHSVAGV